MRDSIKQINVFTIMILGYGLSCTVLYGGTNSDGSLKKFGIKYFYSRWSNPYITFILFYKWITFRLLSGRE